jgi:hypothetical protein
LIRTGEFLLGTFLIELLNLNVLVEAIEAGEGFVTLFGLRFFSRRLWTMRR